MESLLSELGVVNEDETGVQRKVQDLLEETAAAAAAAAKAAQLAGAAPTTTDSRSKRSILESIMDGANAATDPSLLTKKVHTQHSKYQREERVKFIANIEDIPNDHQNELKFHSGRRGYYNGNTSLNLFSNEQTQNEYRTSTNVDLSAVQDIIREAKKQRTTSSSNNKISTSSGANSLLQDSSEGEAEFGEYAGESEPVSTARDVSAVLSRGGVYDFVPDVTPAHSAATSTSFSSAAVEEVICPFCTRSLSHLSSAKGAKAGTLSQVEQHVERCARRGSRNVASYGDLGNEDLDVEKEQSVARPPRRASAAAAKARAVPARKAASARTYRERDEGEEEDGEGLEESDWDSAPEETKSAAPESRRRLTRVSRGGAANSNVNTRASEGPPATASSSAHPSRRSKPTNQPASGEIDVIDLAGDSDGVGEEGSGSGSNEWAGFVASIVDDWEDHAYFSRLEELQTQRETKLHAKQQKSKGQGGANAVVQEVESEYVRTDYGVEVLRRTWGSLHDYQKEGCRWLHKLYDEGVGGILGDEMGLGKTAQMCTHFGSLALLHNENRGPERQTSSIFIVVCPATVLHHWLQEFHHWAPFMRTVILHGISATASELLKLGNDSIPKVLRKLQRKKDTKGLVVVTTYEGLRKHRQALVRIEWTAVCLDEGQKIRNPATEITSTCKMLPAFHRVILSGTPIQNSLRELWSLFDFIYPGRLGALPVFEQEFATPIRSGGYANANALQYEIAIRCAATLQKIVKPYLLRRKKDDLIAVTKLPPKTEQVLFCQISPRQREIYLNIIDSSEVKAVLERRMMAFRAINTLRKLCNHPALVFQQGKVVWTQDPLQAPRLAAGGDAGNADEDEGDDDGVDAALLSKAGSGGLAWADSGKLLVLSKLLPLWYSEGHKVLIFSQTRGMLSIIESMVRELGFLYLRLDGSTPVGKRAGLVNQYNTNPNIFVMLLTTRTGGVGISLTAANRVVLFDPDWNPMTDMQSRERAWRLGQKREVTVYRLITRGTIEEKIYQRQIFKLLLSNRILENAKQKALFSETHMRELFELNDSYSKGGQDRHGHFVGGEALPVGAEINLKQQEAVPAPAPVVPAGTALGLPHEEASGLVELEDYVEAPPLPQEAVDDIEIHEEPAADGSNSRDRRLLQALFAGDAITSVYDHHYFDPSQNRADAKGQDPAAAAARLKKAAARVSVRTEAETAVTKALSGLQSSARVYQGPVPRVEEYFQPASSSSCAPSWMTQGSEQAPAEASDPYAFPAAPAGAGAARPRFGASSASMFGTSSASLLAGLTSQPSDQVPVQRQAGFSQQRSIQPSSSAASMSRVSSSASLGSEGGAHGRVSVKQDIQGRLQTLFAQGDRPLTTAFVLSRFRDLGDQYAPLFRQLLREAAVHRNGTWTKR